MTTSNMTTSAQRHSHIILRNVIFPLWIMALVPPFFFITLIGNYVIDSLIVWWTLRSTKLFATRGQWHKYIVKVWLFGFLADIIGAVVLWLLAEVIFWRYWKTLNDTFNLYNAFDNLTTFLITFTCMAISGLCIYGFNLWLGKRHHLPEPFRRRLALRMAVLTAPWLFLVPTPIALWG